MYIKHNNSRFENHLIENREVRIFLSSTFSDMDAERSALVKLFNKLKLEANQRNVALTLLDLRWGVTEEESRTGKVLSVCLNEIENSHPFFIGLLGSRYGYTPEASELEKNPDLKERYPWIINDISDGMSITEIEMQYGVLRNEDGVDAAFFIKNTSDTLPDDNERLTSLKSSIREQKRFPIGEYKSIDHLCEQIEIIVIGLLDKYFKDSDNTRLGRERNIQQAYINSRHRFYVQRPKDFDRLNRFLNSDERNIVVTGKSGIGKSALIANWLKEIGRNQNLPCNIIYHFVGNSFGGNSYNDVLQHISDELLNLYDCIELRIGNEESLEGRAQRYMSEAVQKGDKPMLIVIDGINQIDDSTQSKLLNWLPQSTQKVKYLFSTLEDDETMQTFRRREYSVYTLEPLEKKDEFIDEYLLLVGKKLNAKQKERILKNAIIENTLVLKTLLDELICFGSYDHLDERINFYLAATSIPAFFDRMLQRLEEDYMDVQRLLSLIAVSEHGLSEDELIEITGMRQMDFHLLYCAISAHLVNRGGLLVFAHQYITNAILSRYHLEDVDSSKTYREEIISYFSSKEVADRDRQIAELAFQYYHVEDCENLYNTILNFEAFNYFDSTSEEKSLLASYWRKLLKTNAARYQLRNYLDLKFEGINGLYTYIGIAIFVTDYLGDYATALMYYEMCLSKEQLFDRDHIRFVAATYNNVGAIYVCQSNYAQALKAYFIALEMNKAVLGVAHLDIAKSYNNIGYAYHAKGDYVKALEFYYKAKKIYENSLNVNTVLATLYNNIGLVYDAQGDYYKSMEYCLKALSIRENELGLNHPDIAQSYCGIGGCYIRHGNYAKALDYFLKSLEIYEKAFGLEHPHVAYSYDLVGNAYNLQGLYAKALESYSHALDIRVKTHGFNHSDTARSYQNIGEYYACQNDHVRALEYYFKALTIQKKILGYGHPYIAVLYGDIGKVFHKQGDCTKALEFYFKALDIQEKKLGKKHHDVSITYGNIGQIYLSQGKTGKALKSYFKALAILKMVLGPEHLEIAASYNNIGAVYSHKKEYTKALEYFYKALAIQEKGNGVNHPNTGATYNNIGGVYHIQGVYSKAIEFYLKALDIQEKILGSEHPELVLSYINMGWCFFSQSKYPEALDYFLKALDIDKKAKGEEHIDVASLYYNIGVIYGNMLNCPKAFECYYKALSISKITFGDDHPYTIQIKKQLGLV